MTEKKKTKTKKQNDVLSLTKDSILRINSYFNDIVIALGSENPCNYIFTNAHSDVVALAKTFIFSRDIRKTSAIANAAYKNILFAYDAYKNEKNDYKKSIIRNKIEKYIAILKKNYDVSSTMSVLETLNNICKAVGLKLDDINVVTNNFNAKYLSFTLIFDPINGLKTVNGLNISNRFNVELIANRKKTYKHITGLELEVPDWKVNIIIQDHRGQQVDSRKYIHRLTVSPITDPTEAYNVFKRISAAVLNKINDLGESEFIIFEPILIMNYNHIPESRTGKIPESFLYPLVDAHTFATSVYDGIKSFAVEDILASVGMFPKLFVVTNNKLGVPQFDNIANVIDLSVTPVDLIKAFLTKQLEQSEKVTKQYNKETLMMVPDRDMRTLIQIKQLYKIDCYTYDEIDELSNAFAGFNLFEIDNIIRDYSANGRKLTRDDIAVIKANKYKNNRLIEFITPMQLDDVGGMDGAKDFIKVLQKAYSEDFRLQYPNVKVPNGVLFVGPAGTGKSLLAKVIGGALNMPVVQLQTEQLKGSLVGSSERKITEAFNIIKAIGRCVVFTDEIEKSVGGIESSSRTDGGTLLAMFGIILQKMQEFMDEKLPIFFVATSNDFKSLPSPLLRRYENVYFVDLPSAKERETIFKIHFNKSGINYKHIDIKRLVEASQGFSGFDIQKIVNESIVKSYADNKPLTTEFIVDYIQNHFFSISKSRQDEIRQYRQEALTYGWKIANSPDAIKNIDKVGNLGFNSNDNDASLDNLNIV